MRFKLKSVLTKMSANSVVALVLLSLAISVTSQKFCNFPIGTNWKNTHKWALFHKNDGSLYPAKEQTVFVPFNEEFTVSCGPNYIAQSNYTKKSIKAKCDKDLYNEEPFLTGDLSCDLRPIEVIAAENSDEASNACEELGGKFGIIAYFNPITKKQMKIGDICLNEKDGYPYHLHAVVQGSEELKNKKWTPLEFDSEYKLDFMKSLKFDQLYQKMREFAKNENFPNFEMSPIFDDTLLGNQQLMSISKIGSNYMLIPEDYKLMHLLQSDIADFGKGGKLVAGFHFSNNAFTLHNSDGATMPLHLVDAFEGDQPRFPIPEKLTVTIKNQGDLSSYEFVLTFNPSATENEVHNDQCKYIPWLKRVNSSPISVRKLISCREIKSTNSIKKLKGVL